MRNKIIFKKLIANKTAYVFLILSILVVKSLNAQLVHPGISHKLSDLERMKQMVKAGVEPYATSFANMSQLAKAQHTYAVNVVNQDPNYLIEYSGASDGWFINDGTAAYYNALMWYITEDTRHAEKAIEIFNTWKNLRRNSMTVPLSSGRIWRIIEAAEIIKHTYDGWAESDIQDFKDMLVYPGYSTTTVPTAAIASGDITFYWRVYQGDEARHGNQGLFCMRTMMAMGIFLDNEIMYERALRYLQGLPHRADDLPYPSGPSINNTTNISSCDYFEEFKRTGSSNAIQDYGYNEVISNYVYENGQCQESSRDQAHGLAGVGTISVMAEMAWNQGDDLYGHLDNRLLLGLEFYYRYNLSYDNVYPDQPTPWEPTVASGEYIERTDRSGRWKSLKINPYLVCSTGEDYLERAKHNLMPVYEMNLAHYRDRLGLDTDSYKWLQRGMDYLTEQIGVEGQGTVTDHPGYGGLKFHRETPGDPIGGFDSNGLPVYEMNDLSEVIEAENYDYFVLDGEDKTYHDVSTSNTGGEYRTDEGVDIKVCSEGGYAVTDIEDGEWLTYTVAVPSTGTYDVSVRYASQNADGSIKFNFAGVDAAEFVAIPNGGVNSTGLTDWKDFKVVSEVRLEAGVQAMKVLFSGASGAFDLNNISLSLVEEEPEPVNLAVLHGTATQSVDSDPCPYTGCADLAIDGNTDGNFNNGSVSHSAHGSDGSYKWWQVDLGANYRLETIDIYNRSGYQNRLNDITVVVIDSEDNVVYSEYYEGYPNLSISLSTGGVVGQVVRVSKTSQYGITLAEVEVYGVDSVVTLSNEDIEFENSVQLYPNPTKGVFTLTNAEGSEVVVYNSLGQVVLKEVIGIDQKQISLNGLSKGVYFVKLNRDRATFTKKLIYN